MGLACEGGSEVAMKVVVNPTWRCQLHCIYCWMHGLGFKPGQECSPRQWLWFLAQLPGPMTVDFSGGEPLLYEGIIDLIQRLAVRDIGWAMTSNLMNAHKVAELCDRPIRGCMGIHVSAHAGGPADLYERAVSLVRAGYPVTINVVDHPAAGAVPEGVGVDLIPYQAWTEGEAVDGIRRQCNAGENHLVMSPDGNVYRCAVEMQLGVAPLGHISQGWESMRPREPHICEIGCSTCYTHDPRAWRVNMEAIP